jgi:hypothetical protein
MRAADLTIGAPDFGRAASATVADRYALPDGLSQQLVLIERLL